MPTCCHLASNQDDRAAEARGRQVKGEDKNMKGLQYEEKEQRA